MDARDAPEVTDAVWTVPNAVTLVRLVCVPVFLVTLLSRHDGWALAVLSLSGVSDYLDGKIARRFGAVSRLGQILDPIADRLTIAAIVIGFFLRDIVPWWFIAAVVVRDLVMSLVVWQVRRRGFRAMEVHFVGKAATFNLLYAFPLLLLGTWPGAVGDTGRILGWAFGWWGLVLYYVAGWIYTREVFGSPRASARVLP